MDVHASAANEKAFPRGNEGGLFTLAFAQAAGRSPDTWAKLIEDTSTTTERLYRAYRQLVLGSDTVTAEKMAPIENRPAKLPPRRAQSSKWRRPANRSLTHRNPHNSWSRPRSALADN